ncbi:MAG: hypothetical protein M3273_06550 [Actinomycetota bacterium]|nr:hypothetical protein [Actinomycetota bacterium]
MRRGRPSFPKDGVFIACGILTTGLTTLNTFGSTSTVVVRVAEILFLVGVSALFLIVFRWVFPGAGAAAILLLRKLWNRVFPPRRRWRTQQYGGFSSGPLGTRALLYVFVFAPTRLEALHLMVCELKNWRGRTLALTLGGDVECQRWGRAATLPDDFSPNVTLPLRRGLYRVCWTAPKDPRWVARDWFYVDKAGRLIDKNTLRTSIGAFWDRVRLPPPADPA